MINSTTRPFFLVRSIALSSLWTVLCGWQTCVAEQTVNFSRDVRPVLAKQCFTCHGPDANSREADLRLDTFDGATADLGGYQALKPGDGDNSELLVRVLSDDPDLRMPPADSHLPLNAREIEILKSWIDSGGEYEMHWSFVPPKPVAVPVVDEASWCRSPIDRFTLRRMEQAGLKPSQPAEKANLTRRLYLDLAGVTPTPEEVDQFVNDDDPMAYQKMVDRLLASPDYAERFTRPWLDLARYSDTNGYEKDRPRTIWPYRDWVISAIAADMPFDQFSIEQLAGDMLPGASLSQRIATGFHRNTMMNEEGGIDPLEYRFYAMVDRVATTGTVWMGLTTGCAQCHTHKYDPITQTDYYSMFALLNNADEPELTADPPAVLQQRKELQKKLRQQENQLAEKLLDSDDPQYATFRTEYQTWVQKQFDIASAWRVIRPIELKSTMPRLSLTKSGSILASGDVTKREVYTLTLPPTNEPVTAIRLEALPHTSLPASGPGMAFYEGRRGDFFLSEFKVQRDDQAVQLRQPSTSYGKISVGSGGADASNVLDGNGSTGWSTSDRQGTANRLVVNFAEPFQSNEPWTIELLFERHFAAALGHFRISVTTRDGGATASVLDSDLEAKLHASKLGTELGRGTENQLRRYFIASSELVKKHRKPIDALKRAINQPVRTLVMRERTTDDFRTTYRHHRGEYLQPKEQVAPAVPAVFDPLEDGRPKNRLALAKWLVSGRNPLVGRVTANRAWRELFGTGIVRTAGDFGTQSELPSHPQLIDYLANQLTDRGEWSMKRLHREIVLSATYQQRAGGAPESDPDHRLLSRHPHRRLDAERIRDALLSAAGLLTHKVGGASVHPPQPATVSQMAYGAPKWKTSTGADRYRRSLYTFSQRTAPFAAYLIFDGPTGELCIARRDRSTTPLQALTLLNDAMYLEIAEGLANAAVRDVGEDATPHQVATRIFRRLLSRPPDEDELQAIISFYQRHAKHESPWKLVARALLNTDEAITTP